MKKNISTSLRFAMAVAMLGIAATGAYALEYSYNTSSLTATVKAPGDGSTYSGDIVIPDSVPYEGKNYAVTTIGSSAFAGCTEVTSITTGKEVKLIGSSAFSGCTSLKLVVLESRVSTIGSGSFSGCSALKAVKLYNTTPPTVYGSDSPFDYSACTLYVPVDAISSYKSSSYWGLFDNIVAMSTNTEVSGLEYSLDLATHTASVVARSSGNLYTGDITIPESVTYNGESYSVTAVGDKAFYKCMELSSITMPNSITSIGAYAFLQCVMLREVKIPESVTSLGRSSFFNCLGLTEVTIPHAVTTIGAQAFYYCLALKSATLGRKLESIGDKAFYECSALDTLKSYNAVPPVLASEDVFNTYSTTTLCVPQGAVDTYKAATYWSRFGKVEVLSDASVDVVGTDKVIALTGNILTVLSSEPYAVYTTAGAVVSRGVGEADILLSSGVYVVKVGSSATKIMVR